MSPTTTTVKIIANSATEGSAQQRQPRSRSTRQPSKDANASDSTAATPPVTPAESSSVPSAADAMNNGEPDRDGSETGPGKRKRKPSTMTKPPSTITAASAPTVGNSSSGSASVRSSSNKSSRARHSTGSCLKKPHLPPLDENSAYNGGYDSDGGKAAFSKDTDVDADADAAEDSDHPPASLYGLDHLEAPPLIFQRNGACLLKSRAAGRSESRKAQQQNPNNNKKRKSSSPGLTKPRVRLSTSPVNNDASVWHSVSFTPNSRFGHHARTQSMPSIPNGQLPSWVGHSLQMTGVSGLPDAVDDDDDDNDSDSSADGDDDDFHRTMLDSDFEELDSWTKLSDFDTPVTTPRSPQSSCGQLETSDTVIGSSIISTETIGAAGKASSAPAPLTVVKKEESVDDVLSAKRGGSNSSKASTPSRQGSASCDAVTDPKRQDCTVFAHALPPSDRPKTHVGLLTLSLPYGGDIKGYASPSNNNKEAALSSRFTTPTLERMASRESYHDGYVHTVSPTAGKGTGKRNSPAHGDKINGSGSGGSDNDAGDDAGEVAAAVVVSTSPTLSPTHAVFALPATGSNEEAGDPDASPLASPFLAARRRDSEDRSPSPIPFRLPEAVAAAEAAAVEDKSVASATTHTSRASSESSMSDDAETPAAAKTALILPDGNVLEDDSIFSLPETMALDEIDAAYGGPSQGAVAGSDAVRAAAAAASSDEEDDDDVDVADRGAEPSVPEQEAEAEAKDDSITTPLKRGYEVDEVVAIVAHDEDDSPRPRKVTRSTAAAKTPERRRGADKPSSSQRTRSSRATTACAPKHDDEADESDVIESGDAVAEEDDADADADGEEREEDEEAAAAEAATATTPAKKTSPRSTTRTRTRRHTRSPSHSSSRPCRRLSSRRRAAAMVK